MTETDAAASTEDEQIERAVLLYVLDVHPVSITVEELVRALNSREPTSDQRNSTVGRTVERLVDYGLLHQNGKLISPTLAAVRLNRLLR